MTGEDRWYSDAVAVAKLLYVPLRNLAFEFATVLSRALVAIGNSVLYRRYGICAMI